MTDLMGDDTASEGEQEAHPPVLDLGGRKRPRRVDADGNLEVIPEEDEVLMDEEEDDPLQDLRRAALEEAGLWNSDDEEHGEDG